MAGKNNNNRKGGGLFWIPGRKSHRKEKERYYRQKHKNR